METLHEIESRDNHGHVEGRCVCCGKQRELVAVCEGFKSIGWCRKCETEKRQGTLDLPAVRL